MGRSTHSPSISYGLFYKNHCLDQAISFTFYYYSCMYVCVYVGMYVSIYACTVVVVIHGRPIFAISFLVFLRILSVALSCCIDHLWLLSSETCSYACADNGTYTYTETRACVQIDARIYIYIYICMNVHMYLDR